MSVGKAVAGAGAWAMGSIRRSSQTRISGIPKTKIGRRKRKERKLRYADKKWKDLIGDKLPNAIKSTCKKSMDISV